MEAIAKRRSAREFARTRTADADAVQPAVGRQRRQPRRRRTHRAVGDAREEIDVYVALPSGAYLYDADANALQLVAGSDLRRVTGYQDFVDEAPLDLVYVADHSRMRLVPVASRESFASAAAGAISQNVYLFAAGNGLSTVIRAWIDRDAIADALGLGHDHQVLLSQTVGFPKD